MSKLQDKFRERSGLLWPLYGMVPNCHRAAGSSLFTDEERKDLREAAKLIGRVIKNKKLSWDVIKKRI